MRAKEKDTITDGPCKRHSGLRTHAHAEADAPRRQLGPVKLTQSANDFVRDFEAWLRTLGRHTVQYYDAQGWAARCSCFFGED